MKLQHVFFLTLISIPHHNLSAGLQDLSKDIVKDCMLIYALAMGSLIAHELGHAIIAKTLWNSPVDITIGALPDESGTVKESPLFKLAGMQFTTLNPFAGGFATATNYPENDISDRSLYQKISFFAAGPLAGLTFLGITFTYFNLWAHASSNLFGSLFIHQIDQIFLTAHQINATTDSKLKSDGEQIREALCILWKNRTKKNQLTKSNL